MQPNDAMRTLGSGRSMGWSAVGQAIRSPRPVNEVRMRGLAGPHIPRLVCRQGPPDFESGLAT